MVLLEAQEFGLPILSFDCETGPAELIDHGNTGWLINDQDYSAFSEELINVIKLFDQDYESFCKIRKNSYKNSQKYHIDAIGPQWKELLK